MNREIKFKIWDKVDKKFLSLKDYQDLGAIEVENDGTLTLSPRFRFLTSMMIMPERFIPLQYSGLKDKNGKEIYEGDILLIGEKRREVEVIFKDGGFGFMYNGTCVSFRNQSPEVIGNIYEREVTNANTTN